MKLIRFDLPINGRKVHNLEELRDNFTTEILELYASGVLLKWLRSRNLTTEADKLSAISTDHNDVDTLLALREILFESFDNKLTVESAQPVMAVEPSKSVIDPHLSTVPQHALTAVDSDHVPPPPVVKTAPLEPLSNVIQRIDQVQEKKNFRAWSIIAVIAFASSIGAYFGLLPSSPDSGIASGTSVVPVSGIAPVSDVVPTPNVVPVSGIAPVSDVVPTPNVVPVSGIASVSSVVPTPSVMPVSGIAPVLDVVPTPSVVPVSGIAPVSITESTKQV